MPDWFYPVFSLHYRGWILVAQDLQRHMVMKSGRYHNSLMIESKEEGPAIFSSHLLAREFLEFDEGEALLQAFGAGHLYLS